MGARRSTPLAKSSGLFEIRVGGVMSCAKSFGTKTKTNETTIKAFRDNLSIAKLTQTDLGRSKLANDSSSKIKRLSQHSARDWKIIYTRQQRRMHAARRSD